MLTSKLAGHLWTLLKINELYVNKRGQVRISEDVLDQLYNVQFGYQTVSWTSAARECQINNGRLAAITTEQQWHDVLKFLTYSKVSLTDINIGLKMNWKTEPFMYRRVLKSSDGALLYFMPQITLRNVPLKTLENRLALEENNYYFMAESCTVGRVHPFSQELNVKIIDCNDNRSGTLGLCELEPTSSVNDSNLNSLGVQMTHQSTMYQDTTSFHGLDRNTMTMDRLCNSSSNYTLVLCPCGHVTHGFLSCDLHSYCGQERFADDCPVLPPAHCQSRLRQWYVQYEQYTAATRDSERSNTPSYQSLSANHCTDFVDDGPDNETSISVAMFVCANQATVHYSLVCDFSPDCLDESDESFCVHLPCKGFTCTSGQCVPEQYRCDSKVHCLDGSDELLHQCDAFDPQQIPRQQPGLIDFKGTGDVVFSDWSHSEPCPDTHYRCTSHPRYCLPIYTRCNGYYDCAGREDERDCDAVRCPGLYRCRGSRVCVHVRHLCDGWPQCPQHDDEWRCQATPCPDSCLCQGLAFVCHNPFLPSEHPDLRYLAMDSTPVRLSSFSHNLYLVYLSLVRCQLSTLRLGFRLPNVQMLDVSSNNITTLKSIVFEELPQIKVLRLAHNPMLDLVSGDNDTKLGTLLVMDLSNTLLQTFSTQNSSYYLQVKELNLSHSKVNAIGEAGFQFSPALEVLDMRGCTLTRFRLDMFRGLQSLRNVFSPNYRLCCDRVLPNQMVKPTCRAPSDHLSSCEDLLKSRVYQVVLFVISVVATAGSAVCFIFRYVQHQEPCLSSNGLLVSSTNVASLLMGLYAGLIAVADQLYRGRYVLREPDWIDSVACQTACFLHLLSHQVSVLTVLVISLDRLVVLYFPNSRFGFNTASTAAACFVTWCVGVIVAVVPVVQSVSAWPLHKQSALCVPLPAPTARFAGDHFHFGAVILQTVAVSSIIAICEAFIFVRLQRRSQSSLLTTNNNVIFAARFYPVALVSALCWLSVSVYGLVTKLDATSAVSQLNAVLAVLLFPFPAAFSPVALVCRQMQEDKQRDIERKILNILRLRALHQQHK